MCNTIRTEQAASYEAGTQPLAPPQPGRRRHPARADHPAFPADHPNGIEYDTAVKHISVELEAQYANNIIGVRIINSLAHQYFINGGFAKISKRSTKKNTKRVVRDLSFP